MIPQALSLSPFEQEALLLSLKVAFWAVFFSLPFGVTLAWALAFKQFTGKSVLEGLLQLPLVLPPVVVGYGLLVVCGRKGWVGAFLFEQLGIRLVFDWKGAVLASALVGLPLMVSAIRLGLISVDPQVIEAAQTLGRGPLGTFFSVTLPLALPGLITGCLLAFARSLGEFGATITFASNIPGQTQTLPLALFTQTQVPGGEMAALRLCVLCVVLAVLALGTSKYLANRFDYKEAL